MVRSRRRGEGVTAILLALRSSRDRPTARFGDGRGEAGRLPQGADGLAALVRDEIRSDPFERRHLCVSGEAGRSGEADLVGRHGRVPLRQAVRGWEFQWPAPRGGAIRLTPAQLSALLEGSIGVACTTRDRCVHRSRRVDQGGVGDRAIAPNRFDEYGESRSWRPMFLLFPDDPETLKAMLLPSALARTVLAQIIKELHRHRFGRAESLPEDQFACWRSRKSSRRSPRPRRSADAEVGSNGAAKKDTKRRANRGALPEHLPAGGDDHRHRGQDLPLLRRCTPSDRRRQGGTTRRDPGAVPHSGGSPPEVRLSRLRGGGGPGPGTGSGDRRRTSNRGDRRPCAGRQVCRSPAALSAAQIYARQGHPSGSLDARRLGRPRPPAAQADPDRLFEALKTSEKLFADETTAPVLDPGRGDEDGAAVGLCSGRPTVGRRGSTRRVYVYAPDRKAERPMAPLRLPRHPAGRRLCGYRPLAEKGAVRLALCWAHVRRKFYELVAADNAPIADEALRRIGRDLPRRDVDPGKPAESAGSLVT